MEESSWLQEVVKRIISFSGQNPWTIFMRFDIKGAWKYRELLEEYERLKDQTEKEIAELEDKLLAAYSKNETLTELYDAMEGDMEYAQAEIKRLKKTRYRWIDHRHGWWPVEGAELDDIVQRVPYVVYTMRAEEKRVPEA